MASSILGSGWDDVETTPVADGPTKRSLAPSWQIPKDVQAERDRYAREIANNRGVIPRETRDFSGLGREAGTLSIYDNDLGRKDIPADARRDMLREMERAKKQDSKGGVQKIDYSPDEAPPKKAVSILGKGWDKEDVAAPEQSQTPEKKPFINLNPKHLAKEVTGMASGVADIAAGIASFPISGIAGLGTLLSGKGVDAAVDTIHGVSDKLSPSSAMTKMGVDPAWTSKTGTSEILQKIMSAPHEYMSKPIADKYFEISGKPLPAAILTGILDIPAYILAAKGAGKVVGSTVRPRSAEALREEAGYIKQEPQVSRTPEGYAPDLPFGEQRIPTRAPYNVLPKELREQLEAELNPPVERRVPGQGELFTDNAAYGPKDTQVYRRPEQQTPMNTAPDLFGEGQRVPIAERGIGNVLPAELRAKLEAELNPPVEARNQRQGELFTEQRPYQPNELLQGRPASMTDPMRGTRDRPDPRDSMANSPRQAQVGEMTSRQGQPYEQMPLARDIREPQQMELVERGLEKAKQQIETIEYGKPLSDLASVGEARARRAEESRRTEEQNKLTSEGVPYQSQPNLFRGPGRNQRGAINWKEIKEGVVGLWPKDFISKVEGWHKAGGRIHLQDLYELAKGVSLSNKQRETLLSKETERTRTSLERRLARGTERDLATVDSILLGNSFFNSVNFRDLNHEGARYPGGTSLRGAMEALNGLSRRIKTQVEEQKAQERLNRFSVVSPDGSLRGPGSRQAGVLRFDQIFKKKPVTQVLLEQRKLFETEKRSASEVAKEMMDKGTKDLSDVRAGLANPLLPKHVALLSQNGLVKWATDKAKLVFEDHRNRIKKTLEGEAYKTGRSGREHRIPGEEGGLTKFRRYFREGRQVRAELSEMKDIWVREIGKTPLTRESFRTERQWQVFSAMKKNLDVLRDSVNNARTSRGMKPIPYLENYFPAMWEGDYFVRVKDSAGETRVMGSTNHSWQAKALQKELQAKFPDHTVEMNAKKASKYDLSDLSAFEEAANALAKEGNSALAKEFNRIYADKMTHRGAGKHGLKRSYVEGFMGMEKGNLGLRNMEHSYEQYTTLMSKHLANIEIAKLKEELAELPPEFRKTQENALKYSKEYLDSIRGKDLAQGADWINNSVSFVTRSIGLGEHSATRGAQNLAAAIVPMWLLTFRNLTVNMAQPLQTIPMLARLKATGEFKGNPTVAFMEGYGNFIKSDKQAIAGANWATRAGKLDPTITSLLEFKLGEAPTSNMRAMMELVKAPSSKIEQNFVRLPAFLIFEKALRDTIKDDVARFEKAANLVDHSMVDYGHESLPIAYNKMGLVGDLAKPLKQFPTNAWGQFFDYVGLAKDHGQLAPLAYNLGTQIAVGGLKGTILVAEATAVISLLNLFLTEDIETPEQLMHRGFTIPGTETTIKVPDALVMGGLSTALGYDVSSSVSAPNFPSMLSMPGAQLGYTWLADTTNFIVKSIKGTATDMDAMRAWLANTPNQVHNWIETLYTDDDGFVPNPKDPQGRGVYQRSAEEKVVGGVLGLRSTQRDGFVDYILNGKILDHLTGGGNKGEAQARALASSAKQLLMLDAKQKVDALGAITDKIQNDQEIPDALLEKYIEEGGNPKNLANDVKKRIIEKSLSPAERPFTKPGMTPDKAHKLERMKELMDLELRDPKKGDGSILGKGWDKEEEVPAKPRKIGTQGDIEAETRAQDRRTLPREDRTPLRGGPTKSIPSIGTEEEERKLRRRHNFTLENWTVPRHEGYKKQPMPSIGGDFTEQQARNKGRPYVRKYDFNI